MMLHSFKNLVITRTWTSSQLWFECKVSISTDVQAPAYVFGNRFIQYDIYKVCFLRFRMLADVRLMIRSVT